MKKLTIGLIAVLSASLAIVGCSNTAEGVKDDSAQLSNDAANAGQAAVQAGQEAANDVANAGQAAGEAVVNGAKAIDNAAENAGEAVANAGTAALVTGKVKTAIVANNILNDSKNTINVDTVNGKVVLTGTVQNKAAKDLAGQTAKKVLTDNKYTETVDNQLTVGSK